MTRRRFVRRAVFAVGLCLAASPWGATAVAQTGPSAAPPRAAAAPGARSAHGVAVEGSDTARLAVAPELARALDGWSNAGYRVRRTGEGEITVDVRLEPLRSEAPFTPRAPEPASGENSTPSPADRAPRTAPESGSAPATDLAALATGITRGAGSRYAAVSAVLGWMVRNVLDERQASPPPPRSSEGGAADGPGPPGGKAGGLAEVSTKEAGEASAAEVLARGAGDPAGIARLAVALLETLGIEARVVRGVVVAEPDGGRSGAVGSPGPRGRHAWIEVVYPDRGGVFSDPLHTHHYVPATYLRIPAAEPVESAERGPGPPPSATLLERSDRRLTVDVYPAGSPGITARKNRDRQEAGTLRVVVAGDPRGSVALVGQGARRARELVRGESVFVGLEAGSYTVEVFVEGRPPTRREVVVGPRERAAVYLNENRSATAAPGRPGAGEPPAGSS